jgi:hypothetical protein
VIVGVGGMTHMMRAMTHMLRALFHIFRAVCHMSRGCACCTRASRRANSTLLCACCVRACVRARVCACVRACVRVKCRNWCTSRQHDRCEAPDPRMHTFSNPFIYKHMCIRQQTCLEEKPSHGREGKTRNRRE